MADIVVVYVRHGRVAERSWVPMILFFERIVGIETLNTLEINNIQDRSQHANDESNAKKRFQMSVHVKNPS